MGLKWKTMCNGAPTMSEIAEMLDSARVMPILTIADAAIAADLARALEKGGIKVCEVTLRTPAALAAITEMRKAAPNLITGAGTIRTARDIDDALTAGAQFLVTPGTSPTLAAALAAKGAPCLPGAATASEALELAELGFSVLKFFPAEQAGGTAMLKAFQGPMPDLRFCPTGGITKALAPAYLALETVVCVGGSWIAPEAAQAARDWVGIEANALATVHL
jgi:2-dehydro-3-deoxyphosphogluconate aldolase / (4S)-4-hydroxy-2-oxoglutarate aldolase